MTEHLKAAHALIQFIKDYPDAIAELGSEVFTDAISDLHGAHNREIENRMFDGTIVIRSENEQLRSDYHASVL